ncbi:MAG TPA: glycosyltransferase [Flavobacteriales bacterium]|nr:glycosyltransferase [Flavobacteriales bacterium]
MSVGVPPRVTVLMTLFNKGRYVEEAVRSVLANSFTDIEVLVVDDASTDEGPERVRAIGDPRVRLLTTTTNGGRPTAANRGYDAARGEFIAVLDADDVMHSDRIKRQVEFLDGHPDVGAVGSSLSVFGEKAEQWNWASSDEEARGRMLFSDPVCYGTCMLRRSILDEHHLRCDTAWLYPGMDYLFLLTLAPHLRFANIQEPLTLYRVGDHNMRHGRDPLLDRARIYREQFTYFGLAATDEEIRLQLMLHRLFFKPPSSDDVRALWRWVNKLKRMNRSAQVFPVSVFEQELDRRWRRLFHPIADVDGGAAWQHVRSGGGWTFGHLRYGLVAARNRMVTGKKMSSATGVFTVPAVPVRSTRSMIGHGGASNALPRITVITPSFQQAEYLEECLRSVRDQAYPDLEHFVVDGGSDDGSLAIIERNADRLDWWCSERDGGQSDAIAKGGVRATGDIFGWLNSDDVLLPGALNKVGRVFQSDPNALVVCGARILRKPEGDSELAAEDPENTETYFTAPRINQQSTFYRMSVMREVGFVERKLNYVMDYELWLQVMFRYGSTCVHSVPEVLSVFRQHATSKTSTVHYRFLDEMASVLHGLCASTGLVELMTVLESGHTITPGLRRIPLVDANKEVDRVHHMVVSFLLKWHHWIWSESDFRMMRAFRATVHVDLERLTTEQREHLRMLDDQIGVPGWMSFRLRRKWKHLAP